MIDLIEYATDRRSQVESDLHYYAYSEYELDKYEYKCIEFSMAEYLYWDLMVEWLKK